MINLLKLLLIDDWRITHSFRADWGEETGKLGLCYYTVEYSAIRGYYRMSMAGETAAYHPYRSEVAGFVGGLNQGLIQRKKLFQEVCLN